MVGLDKPTVSNSRHLFATHCQHLLPLLLGHGDQPPFFKSARGFTSPPCCGLSCEDPFSSDFGS